MKIKVIKTEEDYNAACDYMYSKIQENDNEIEPDSEIGEKLELLSILIEDYEKRMNYQLDTPDPIEVIKIKMKEKSLKQKDLISVLGSKSTVSKIMNRQRALTIDMVKKLSQFLNVPVQLLVGV